MNTNDALELILGELKKAKDKFPGWPSDPVHGAAILAEESGELTQAAIDYFYERYGRDDLMKKEAAQVGAMALRFLIGLPYIRESQGPKEG